MRDGNSLDCTVIMPLVTYIVELLSYYILSSEPHIILERQISVRKGVLTPSPPFTEVLQYYMCQYMCFYLGRYVFFRDIVLTTR